MPILFTSLPTSPNTDHSVRFLCSYINWLNDLKVKSKTKIQKKTEMVIFTTLRISQDTKSTKPTTKTNRQHRIGKTQVANKYRERSPTSITIRELQIKKISKYHFKPIRLAIWSNNIKYWQGYGARERLIYCWWETQLVQALYWAIL